jgi:hypothetical protein
MASSASLISPVPGKHGKRRISPCSDRPIRLNFTG